MLTFFSIVLVWPACSCYIFTQSGETVWFVESVKAPKNLYLNFKSSDVFSCTFIIFIVCSLIVVYVYNTLTALNLLQGLLTLCRRWNMIMKPGDVLFAFTVPPNTRQVSPCKYTDSNVCSDLSKPMATCNEHCIYEVLTKTNTCEMRQRTL